MNFAEFIAIIKEPFPFILLWSTENEVPEATMVLYVLAVFAYILLFLLMFLLLGPAQSHRCETYYCTIDTINKHRYILAVTSSSIPSNKHFYYVIGFKMLCVWVCTFKSVLTLPTAWISSFSSSKILRILDTEDKVT